MTRKIQTKQLIHTFLFLLSLLLRGLKVPNKAGGSQVSQGEASQDYLPLENTSSWKIPRKTVLWQLFVSLSSVSHLETSPEGPGGWWGRDSCRLAVRVTLWLSLCGCHKVLWPSPGLPS